VAAWADGNGVNVLAAEGLHDKLRRLFNTDYIVEKPAATASPRSSSRSKRASTWCCRSAHTTGTWTTCWSRTC
jgi:hypothetical protein